MDNNILNIDSEFAPLICATIIFFTLIVITILVINYLIDNKKIELHGVSPNINLKEIFFLIMIPLTFSIVIVCLPVIFASMNIFLALLFPFSILVGLMSWFIHVAYIISDIKFNKKNKDNNSHKLF